MTKQSYFPYPSTYNSTRLNTNRKHNVHHMPYTTIQHTSTLLASKPTIFNNGCYTTNIPTYHHKVTTTYIKTNLRYIHTYIVSRYLATNDNIKIQRTPPPHSISSANILNRLTRRTLAQLRTYKSPFLILPHLYLNQVLCI